jgi:hypothetical protein
MSQINQPIEELYSFLFAVRISLQDNYNNESDIIIELKKYLIDIGENYSTIKQTLFGFYQYYDIDIDIATIEQALNYDNQILNEMLGVIMNVNNSILPVIPNNPFIPNNSNNHNNPVIPNNPINPFILNNPINPVNPDDHSDNHDDHSDNHDSNNEYNVGDEPPPLESNYLQNNYLNNQMASNHIFTFQILPNGQIKNNNFNSVLNASLGPNINMHTHAHMSNLINSMLSGLGNNIQVQQPANMFQDVVVTVDDKDIEKLHSTKLESDKDTDCSICMGHMEKDEIVTELKCKHMFHTECIETYLKQYNHKCPVCRSEVGNVKYNF